ncbi:MAG: hypothetical protein RML12_09685 [Xanthomonadales bacterium]|nr:hypothetical protein [Xanthomonadales bacterium]
MTAGALANDNPANDQTSQNVAVLDAVDETAPLPGNTDPDGQRRSQRRPALRLRLRLHAARQHLPGDDAHPGGARQLHRPPSRLLHHPVPPVCRAAQPDGLRHGDADGHRPRLPACRRRGRSPCSAFAGLAALAGLLAVAASRRR